MIFDERDFYSQPLRGFEGPRLSIIYFVKIVYHTCRNDSGGGGGLAGV